MCSHRLTRSSAAAGNGSRPRSSPAAAAHAVKSADWCTPFPGPPDRPAAAPPRREPSARRRDTPLTASSQRFSNSVSVPPCSACRARSPPPAANTCGAVQLRKAAAAALPPRPACAAGLDFAALKAARPARKSALLPIRSVRISAAQICRVDLCRRHSPGGTRCRCAPAASGHLPVHPTVQRDVAQLRDPGWCPARSCASATACGQQTGQRVQFAALHGALAAADAGTRPMSISIRARVRCPRRRPSTRPWRCDNHISA